MFQALHCNLPSTRVIQQSFLQSGNRQEDPKQYANNDDNVCERPLLDQSKLIYNQMLEDIKNTCVNEIATDIESLQSSKELSMLS
jgi:hypothetical protein